MDHLPERCRSCGMPCLEKVDFLKGLPENVLEEIFRETSQSGRRQFIFCMRER